MTELGIERGTVSFHVVIDFRGDRFQGFQMRIRIAIAESVIRDQVEAFIE